LVTFGNRLTISAEIMQPRAVYIHVPFCRRRCPYCNFTVAVDTSGLAARYLNAVTHEICRLDEIYDIDYLFIGGGTPTLLSCKELETLFAAIRSRFRWDSDLEWTVEANPNDLDQVKGRFLAESGVNRISIGGQSFDDNKLKTLGREHAGLELFHAIEQTSKWIGNVSLDLIFGVPGETHEVWQADLKTAGELPLSHVSTYGLTYEKGAAFWGLKQSGKLDAVSDDDELRMYFEAIDYLELKGFRHYEVSNFAREQRECRHNQTYWSLQPWFGFGPGAAGFVNNVRTVNHRSTTRYLQLVERQESPVAECESISPRQLVLERFVFGMRRRDGVDLQTLIANDESAAGSLIQANIEKHIAAGWMEIADGKVRLTRQGLALSDSLWPDYLD
jgi:oxygen-independent coproporphyrinogen-3 oxidase